MAINHIFYLFLGLACLGAMIFDFKTKKIPNSFNIPCLIFFLFFYNFLIEPIALNQLFIWWILCFILWMSKAVGGGDAKMLFWLGIGIPQAEYFPAMMGIILLGGLYVGISALLKKNVKSVIINMRDLILRRAHGTTKIYFSPVIVLAMAFAHFKGWRSLF